MGWEGTELRPHWRRVLPFFFFSFKSQATCTGLTARIIRDEPSGVLRANTVSVPEPRRDSPPQLRVNLLRTPGCSSYRACLQPQVLGQGTCGTCGTWAAGDALDGGGWCPAPRLAARFSGERGCILVIRECLDIVMFI